ncbi:p21-C-terminal region-binding protein-domain-containing protein [Endogone sp. FLAS-F59071]|nr:p21-C-terminal region-binding protein-domain-containing protein [Endogone sp. FLAS-F59071]|eukprot:RUS19326.1 p21-C-terminal region-binding protein-domain-containing protein [Endogone sp. FLAS-F59071]
MSKRKAAQQKDPNQDTEMKIENREEDDHDDDGDDDDDDLEQLIDVDFEFFDPRPIDFHALKRLLIQLFSADSEMFSLSELTELILSQPLLGSTVKVDGPESDPFALLTVLNMNDHKDKSPIQEIRKYLLEKCPKRDIALHMAVSEILSPDRPQGHDVGLLLSERFVNMPVQIMPPMYKMLMEEIDWAVEDVEPYDFEWYVIISKTYKEVAPTVDDDNDEAKPSTTSKPKKKKTKMHHPLSDAATFYFHPEDEIVAHHAAHQYDFRLTRQDRDASADSRSTFSEFGIAPARRVFVVHRDRIQGMVEEMESACAV